ncbi:MAG TPA: hypothetical protein VGN72_21280 [Tepidisphaeraceae bacterium]|jgi:hypothetical protein|nr:hypothetical protein [Tepidisphaeraceae bacterium]
MQYENEPNAAGEVESVILAVIVDAQEDLVAREVVRKTHQLAVANRWARYHAGKVTAETDPGLLFVVERRFTPGHVPPVDAMVLDLAKLLDSMPGPAVNRRA